MPTPGRHLSSTLLVRVLVTIGYTDQFAYPLSAKQVWQRLVSLEDRQGQQREPRRWWLPGSYPPELPRRTVRQALDRLEKLGLVSRDQDWYFLAGRSEQVAVRQERAVSSQTKRSELDQLIRIVKHLPWIRAVALTGSLAMDNAGPQEDTDLMIITSPGRLWLARLMVTAVALLKGKRRSWSGEELGSWCFNLWLDGNHLGVLIDKRSVYTAYEVIQADFVLSKQLAADAFFEANHWLYRFLPHSSFPGWAPHSPSLLEVALTNIDTLLRPVWSGLNAVSYLVQRWYMRPHQTSERVALGYAYFHPRDTRQDITDRWRQSLVRLIERR
ncbi:MAG: hypothetical protein COU69_04610 [Candidatus Pacebacteria bacterium CG10_big_fil_rev_8_21_14_0_10_56_10]|nr:MAG: hypothetical protein COU69_04610 [Candidatus Pacebacteria bacterium CG10_big_fil_rev_8_21_14_0_10_56_10]